VTTVDQASGGSDEETIASIRFNAPRHFQTQERAVVTSDYEQLVLENFPDVSSARAYGGEEVVGLSGSVDFGKVYVACSTSAGTPITDSRKLDVTSFLKTRAVESITPVVVDPDYTYMNLICKVHADFKRTSLTSKQIETAVRQSISVWNNENLKAFGNDFRFSQLTSAINQTDESIISNEVDVVLYKLIEPILGIKYSINVSFDTPIVKGNGSHEQVHL
jgi:hypothetical protein